MYASKGPHGLRLVYSDVSTHTQFEATKLIKNNETANVFANFL